VGIRLRQGNDRPLFCLIPAFIFKLLKKGELMKTKNKELKSLGRVDLMQELNRLLGTDYNWRRLNILDLKRLVESVRNIK